MGGKDSRRIGKLNVPGKDAPRDLEKRVRTRIKELELDNEPAFASVRLSSCYTDAEAILQEGRQLDLEGKILIIYGPVKANCLTDTGASALSFVNIRTAKLNKLPMVSLTRPCKLRLADDKLAPNITYIAQVKLVFDNYIDEMWCLVTELG